MDSDPPPDFSVPLVPALSEAETIASQILGGSLALSCKSVERLADLLLAEAPDSDGRFSQGRSVSAGLYHRHKLGLRRLCTSHPQSVRALNSFVTFLAPDHFYSSLVLIDGIASVAHCDVANAALPNLVIPVTSFSGGELRVAHPSGSDLLHHEGCAHAAVTLPVSRGPVLFSASSCLHEVLPFVGRRLVLVAYTLQAVDAAPAPLLSSLLGLGFRTPPTGVAAAAVICPPRMLPLEDRQRAVLPALQTPIDSCPANPVPHSPDMEIAPVLSPVKLPDFTDAMGRGRFFLDICSGARAPVSQAMKELGRDCFLPIDIIHGPDMDLLNDACYFQLLGLCSSGLVGAALASPPCGEFSRLKLRPGGPAPCRTPDEPDGCCDNDWDQARVAQESALLHDRCRELLSRVLTLGGCVVFEQPPSSMTFLVKEVQQWFISELPFGAQVAACCHSMDVSKRWLFLSNRPGILKLASSCQHGSRAHQKIWGSRADDGTFLSRLTAEYPSSLATSLAGFLSTYTSAGAAEIPWQSWKSLLPTQPVWPTLTRRVEDGAGFNSTAYWISPQAPDFLGDLRKAWSMRLCQDHLCLRLCRTLQFGTDAPPLSEEELRPFLDDLCTFCGVPLPEAHEFLSVQAGQPFRLNVLEKLLQMTHDPEAAMCADLRRGVRIGVDHDLVPSAHWPLRHNDPVCTDLNICEGSWKSASDHPDQVRQLLEQEIAEGWITEQPSLESLHANFPAVAIGKLGLVLAEGRSPRLTVDSSISGVTAACRIPNHMSNPRISDVADCAPICLGQDSFTTVSLDVRKAHRQIMVAKCDQALLAFTFEGRVFTSNTLNFGARASAFWWARVGGALLRLSHLIIWLTHLLWGYVDDFLGGFRQDVAPISASLWFVLLMVLRVPLSWSKCSWSSECTWIGWDINLETWMCGLPSIKVSKVLAQIEELLTAGPKVKFKTLESIIGRLLWITGLWSVLRPLLAPLYAALQRVPASSVGVSPELWASIRRNLDDDCSLRRSVNHPSFHRGARITRVGNSFVDTRAQLEAVPFRKRRLWVEVKDPDNPLRVLSDAGRSCLIAWRAVFQGTPFVRPLRTPTRLTLTAEADAFAESDSSGLGGYVLWPSGRNFWFSMRLSAADWAKVTDLFPAPLQSHISALELLAQLLLLWCAFAALPSARGLCQAQLRCDNSGAEACAEKGLSSVRSMSEVVKKFLSFQAWAGIQADIEHIPGYRNDLADELSRLDPGAPAPLAGTDRLHPPLRWLLSQRPRLEPSTASWPEPFAAILATGEAEP